MWNERSSKNRSESHYRGYQIENEVELPIKVTISELVCRSDSILNNKVSQVDKQLSKYCRHNNWDLISHANITVKDLNKGSIHLLPSGNATMFSNLIKHLNWILKPLHPFNNPCIVSPSSVSSSSSTQTSVSSTVNDQETKLDFNLPQIKGFKIAALNITSLLRHIDELCVQMFNKIPDILIINETRLDDTCESEFHIDGHSVITKNRNRPGGGIAIHIRDPIDFINRKDLRNENLKFLFVEIRKPKTKPFLVNAWYRPPNSSINLFVDFEAILKKIEKASF